MRGTRSLDMSADDIDRNTPAYAGNTMRSSSLSSSIREHPRVCGEHGFAAKNPAMAIGTPPRMRGTRNIILTNKNNGRNTPAYAGNTIV